MVLSWFYAKKISTKSFVSGLTKVWLLHAGDEFLANFADGLVYVIQAPDELSSQLSAPNLICVKRTPSVMEMKRQRTSLRFPNLSQSDPEFL